MIFGAIGGHFIKLLQGKGDIGPLRLKNQCSFITVPPLVGMIVCGCISRNAFGWLTVEHYPEVWADWVRQICLSIILMRGGMELEFEGKGLTVLLLTFCPQIVEASTVAVLSRLLFGMPWTLCFANGFCLGAVSPAVLVPSIMILIEQKLGTKKGIPLIMLAASSFDDIVAITVFSILVSLSFESIGATQADSVGGMVLWNVAQILIGIVIGVGLGISMKAFECCKCFHSNTLIKVKFGFMLSVALATPYVFNVLSLEESKYIFIITYGYVCFRVWGDQKPDKELAFFWQFCQPFLFGSIGASILFSDI